MVLVTDPASGGGGPLSRSLDRLREQMAYLEEQRRKREEEERRRLAREAAEVRQAAARRMRENAERERAQSQHFFLRERDGSGLGGQIRRMGSAAESIGGGLGRIGQGSAGQLKEMATTLRPEDAVPLATMAAQLASGPVGIGRAAAGIIMNKRKRDAAGRLYEASTVPLVREEDLVGPDWLRRGVSQFTTPQSIGLTVSTGGLGKGGLFVAKAAGADLLGSIGYEATKTQVDEQPWYIREPVSFGGAIAAGSAPFAAGPITRPVRQQIEEAGGLRSFLAGEAGEANVPRRPKGPTEIEMAGLEGQPTPASHPYQRNTYVAVDDPLDGAVQTPTFRSAVDKMKEWLTTNIDARRGGRESFVSRMKRRKLAEAAEKYQELVDDGVSMAEARRIAFAGRRVEPIQAALTAEELTAVKKWAAKRAVRLRNVFGTSLRDQGIIDALESGDPLMPHQIEYLQSVLHGTPMSARPRALAASLTGNEYPIPLAPEDYLPVEVLRAGVGPGQTGGKVRNLYTRKMAQIRKNTQAMLRNVRREETLNERALVRAEREAKKTNRREVREALAADDRAFRDEIAAIRRAANSGDETAEEAARIAAANQTESVQAVRLEIRAERFRAAAAKLEEQARQRPAATNRSGQNRYTVAAQEMRQRALDADAAATRSHQTYLENIQAALSEKADNATARQVERQNRKAETAQRLKDERDPNIDILTRRIDEMVQNADPGVTGVISDDMKASIVEALQAWVGRTQAIIDGSDNLPRLSERVALLLQGDVPSPFLARLLHQEDFLASALKRMGVEDDFAEQIARDAIEREIKARFPQALTPAARAARVSREVERMKGTELTPAQRRRIAESIVDEQAPLTDEGQAIMDALNKVTADQANPLVRAGNALAEINQTAKDVAFWMDIAVFMQQGLKTVISQPIPLFVGAVNRTLARMHMPHWQLYDLTQHLDRRVISQIDGLKQGGRTGAVELRPGGLVESIPGFGRLVAALTDFQFGTVLGGMRNLAYEGQLAILKASGEDILDPIVRQNAANRVNASSSYWHSAQRAGRATLERNARLSSQMTKAQIAEVNHWLKVIYPHARRDERIGGLVGILGMSTATIGTVYAVDQMIGDGKAILDPTKPGFGWVTIPGIKDSDGHALRIGLVPQVQFSRTLARSLRELATFDLEESGQQWTKWAISGLPPVTGAIGKMAGYGYQPGQGVRLGDWGEGMSPWERILAAAPVPPMLSSVVTGETKSVIQGALESAGTPTYYEDDWDQFREKVESAPWNPDGRSFFELKEWEQEQAYREFGRPLSTKKATRERQQTLEDELERLTEDQNDDDAKFQRGEMSPDQWRNYRDQRQAERQGYLNGLYALLPGYTEKDPSPVDRRRAFIEELKTAPGAGGRPDWDKVAEWEAALSPEDKAYLKEYEEKHLREGTALEKEYWKAQDTIASSGYWDIERGRTQFLRDNPNIRALAQKWGYSDSITTYLDAEDRAKARLDASKGLLSTDPRAWRSVYRDTMSDLAAQADVLFKSETREYPAGGVGKWLQFIDAHKNPVTQTVDWDAVDEDIRTKMTAAEKAELDAYEGRALTPEVREYKNAVKRIEESGYWDIGDSYARRLAARYGFDGATTMNQVRERLMQTMVERYMARGMGQYEAMLRADTYVDRRLSRYESRISQLRQRFRRRRTNRDISALLAQWGFWDPGVADTRRLVAS